MSETSLAAVAATIDKINALAGEAGVVEFVGYIGKGAVETLRVHSAPDGAEYLDIPYETILFQDVGSAMSTVWVGAKAPIRTDTGIIVEARNVRWTARQPEPPGPAGSSCARHRMTISVFDQVIREEANKGNDYSDLCVSRRRLAKEYRDAGCDIGLLKISAFCDPIA